MVEEVNPGDWIDIDQYVKELEESGYEADYDNDKTWVSGFLATIYVEGEEHAVVEGSDSGHMVKDVVKSLDRIEK
jgi:hypothetical protein